MSTARLYFRATPDTPEAARRTRLSSPTESRGGGKRRSPMLSKSSFRTLAPLIAAALLALLTPRANAQFGMGGMGMGGMQQDVLTKRGVEAYAKILGLDKDQHEVAMTLLEGSTTEYKAAQKKFEDGMKDIQAKVSDTQDFTLYQKEMPKL